MICKGAGQFGYLLYHTLFYTDIYIFFFFDKCARREFARYSTSFFPVSNICAYILPPFTAFHLLYDELRFHRKIFFEVTVMHM